MSAGGGGFVRRSGFTNPYQDLRSVSGSDWCFWIGGSRAYHSLPYFPHPRHDALVLLAWSGHRLPTLTNLPIWVLACRAVPLPIITTAAKGLGDTEHIAASIQHQVTGWHRVIRVDNVAHGVEPLGTIRSGCTVAHGPGRHREEKSFLNQAGRLVFLYPWW